MGKKRGIGLIFIAVMIVIIFFLMSLRYIKSNNEKILDTYENTADNVEVIEDSSDDVEYSVEVVEDSSDVVEYSVEVVEDSSDDVEYSVEVVEDSSDVVEYIVDESQDSSFISESSETDKKWFLFRTQELYDSHYIKHGAEFGVITQIEYLQKANDLINSDKVDTKYDVDGDLLYYSESLNEFLVLSTDGYIRTFFRPDDGVEYFNRQ